MSENVRVLDNGMSNLSFALLFALALVFVLRHILAIINIPGQIIIFIFGITMANIYTTGYVTISPDTLLIVYCPIVILKITYEMDNYLFQRSLGQILCISTFGLLTCVMVSGVLSSLLSTLQVTVMGIMLSGILLSTVDVPHYIFSYDTIKQVGVFMGGDCIVGLSVALFTLNILDGWYKGIISQWYQIVCLLIRYVSLGLMCGFLSGKTMSFILARIYSDIFIVVCYMVACSYMLFALCEYIIFGSGTLATFTFMIYMSREKARLTINVTKGISAFVNVCQEVLELFIGILITTYLTVHYFNYKNYFTIVIACGVYLISSTCRFIILLSISPVLSRMGYGFSFQTMFCLYWGAQRCVIQLVLLYFIIGRRLDTENQKVYVCYTFMTCILTLCLNSTTLPLFLKRMKLLDLPPTKQTNIANCIKYLWERRTRIISIMKMNRFFSDANWPLIQEKTKLSLVAKMEEIEVGNVLGIAQRESQCPSCLKIIKVKPTAKEFEHMKREIHMRILRSERVSFIRQFENGLLTKEGMRALTQAVDVATDSPDLYIKLDDLYLIFKEKGLLEKTKFFLLHFFKTEAPMKVPRRFLRSQCYRLSANQCFEIFVLSLTLLYCVLVLVQIFYVYQDIQVYVTLIIFEHFFFILFIIEFAIRVLACSEDTKTSGFRIYLRYKWNQLDFIALCVTSLDWLYSYVNYFHYDDDPIWEEIATYFRYAECIRILKLLKIFHRVYPKFLTYCDRMIDIRVSHAYRIGMALVIGYEEVIEKLPNISGNKEIRDDLMQRLNNDRLAVTHQLALIQKDRPWITITVKTKQAIASTLKYMQVGVHELKQCGIADRYEHNKLKAILDERLHLLWNQKNIDTITPKTFFYEIPWMPEETYIADYMYENVATKVWDAGDIIYEKGQVAEGIFVIVAGVLKTTYFPEQEYLDNLTNYGALPIKEVLNNRRFSEEQSEYIMMGNTLGELAVLTGRPYSSTIYADTPSQTFFIQSRIFMDALDMSKDPVDGLTSRIWKCATVNLAKSVLMDTHMYQSTTDDQIMLVLGRAFVPDLSCYKLLVLSEMIEDIILLEGVLVDFNTREIYTAPCYVPRTVNKILLPKSELFSLDVKTKTILMIIPDKEADEYELMERTQLISELVTEEADTPCLVQAAYQRPKKRFRNMLDSRRKKFTRNMSSVSQTSKSKSVRSWKYGKSTTKGMDSVSGSLKESENTLSDETTKSINDTKDALDNDSDLDKEFKMSNDRVVRSKAK